MPRKAKNWVLAATASVLIAGAAGLAVAHSGGNVMAVSGKQLDQTGADLIACLARNCAPPEDIAASIAHGDTLFAAGKWKESAATFEASRDRNRKFAAKYPVEVAGLLRAFGHIALLRGNPGGYRMAIFDAADALREGLGDADPRVLVARVEVVDVIAHDARPFNTAENRYQALLKEARERNLVSVEGLILYRMAVLYTRGATLDRNAYERRAIAACDALIADTRAEVAPYAAAARSLRNMVGAFYGDRPAAERLVGAARTLGVARPDLLSFEPIEYTGTILRTGTRFEKQELVAAFWIHPDGRVRDSVLVLASAEVHNRDDWLPGIAASINSRRYAPLTGLAATDPGVLRVERYTLTARGGGQPPLIEMRDLTDWAPSTVEVPTKRYVVGK